MIGLPTPSEYAALSYSQRVRVLDRLDRLKLAYLDTERPNGQIRRPVPWDSLKEGYPPAYSLHIGRQILDQLGAGDE